MGLRDLGDLYWEQLVIIHEHAIEFYQRDKKINLAPFTAHEDSVRVNVDVRDSDGSI